MSAGETSPKQDKCYSMIFLRITYTLLEGIPSSATFNEQLPKRFMRNKHVCCNIVYCVEGYLTLSLTNFVISLVLHAKMVLQVNGVGAYRGIALLVVFMLSVDYLHTPTCC